MANNKWIWLDMDGTIADFYSVEGWLNDLENFNSRPYRVAKPMYDMNALIEVLLRLKMDKGYNIGVISWLSKSRNEDFEKEVTSAKLEWLRQQHIDMVFDKILITSYGIRKATTCKNFGSGILIDDEEKNLNDWDLGSTINANEDIIKKLWELL